MTHFTGTRRIVAAAGGVAAALTVVAGFAPITAVAAGHGDHHGTTTVYTLGNAAAGNVVLAFHDAGAAGLTPLGSFATGGLGGGAGLGSQGALAVADGGSRLLAVNAGSNSVSVFDVRDDGRLRLLGSAPSGGAHPISVSAHGHLVYVLDAGSGTVSGLHLGNQGLVPISGSTRALSTGAQGAVQVSFTPNGDHLIVTEKLSNTIDSFAVRDDGRLGILHTTASTGTTPFGFDFDASGHALVSNAAGGAPGASSLTSYRVHGSGVLLPVGPPVPDGQAAACWVVTDLREGHAYVANTGSGTVSSYDVARDGSLSLRQSVAATTGGAPADEALGHQAHALYVLVGPGMIARATVLASGDLGPASIAAVGLPAGATGLATVSDD